VPPERIAASGKDEEMTNGGVGAELLGDFRGAVMGPVLAPGDPAYERVPPAWNGLRIASYDEARMAWNGLFDRRPDVIAQCMGVADVQAAVRLARANDLRIAVRGGGHSGSGSSTIEGGILIDLSLMRGVHVDRERRTAVAAGGTLLGELDRETQAHGLACPSGAVSHTGIAGLTLGGGVGRLMRRFGLTCDNVLGFDVVTAEGEWLHADADHHPDLFWALRGGGGAFGVVTHFEYALHPLGPTVYGGFLGWPLAQARDVYEQVHAHLAAAPDELQTQYIFCTAPVADFVPAALQGQPILMMTATWAGAELADGERWIAPLRERVAPELDLVGPFPYTMLQSAADALAPHGRRNAASMSGYVRDVGDDLIDVAIAQAEAFPSPFGFVELSQMGGAVARVPRGDTAAGPFRDAGWLYVIGANCLEESEVAACSTWTFDGDAALQRFRLPGRYINFVSDDHADNIRESFGAETYGRLLEVKATYDPDGVFSYNPNREPVPQPA
jgi:FAD/FMN-containing dehydrogenase